MDQEVRHCWERQEPGWHTSEAGGVCRERGGRWYGYPAHRTLRERLGPFRTLREAMAAVERDEREKEVDSSLGGRACGSPWARPKCSAWR